jgi:hypothetical protein
MQTTHSTTMRPLLLNDSWKGFEMPYSSSRLVTGFMVTLVDWTGGCGWQGGASRRRNWIPSDELYVFGRPLESSETPIWPDMDTLCSYWFDDTLDKPGLADENLNAVVELEICCPGNTCFWRFVPPLPFFCQSKRQTSEAYNKDTLCSYWFNDTLDKPGLADENLNAVVKLEICCPGNTCFWWFVPPLPFFCQSKRQTSEAYFDVSNFVFKGLCRPLIPHGGCELWWRRVGSLLQLWQSSLAANCKLHTAHCEYPGWIPSSLVCRRFQIPYCRVIAVTGFKRRTGCSSFFLVSSKVSNSILSIAATRGGHRHYWYVSGFNLHTAKALPSQVSNVVLVGLFYFLTLESLKVSNSILSIADTRGGHRHWYVGGFKLHTAELLLSQVSTASPIPWMDTVIIGMSAVSNTIRQRYCCHRFQTFYWIFYFLSLVSSMVPREDTVIGVLAVSNSITQGYCSHRFQTVYW